MASYAAYLKKLKQSFGRRKSFLSSEAVTVLASSFGITKINAQKVISRFKSGGILYSSVPIRFSHGDEGCAFKNDRNLFLPLVEKYKPSLTWCRRFLLDHHIISTFVFKKIMACSNNPRTKNRSYTHAKEELGTLLNVGFSGGEKFIFLKQYGSELSALTKRCFLCEEPNYQVIDLFCRQQEAINFISPKTVLFRSRDYSSPSFKAYSFDMVGHSKSLANKNDDCLVLYDIDVVNPYDATMVKSFKKRIDDLFFSSIRQKDKAIGVILYKSIDRNALHLARSFGFLLYDYSSLFGEAIIRTLDFINRAVRCGGTVSPLLISETMKAVEEGKQHCDLGNIKGTLFEFLVYSILMKAYGGGGAVAVRDTIVTDPYTGHQIGDIDIAIGVPGESNEKVLVECKSSVTKIPLGSLDAESGRYTCDSVKRFENIFLSYKQQNPKENTRFCFFAANGFQDDAKHYMTDTIGPTYRSNELMEWYDLKRVKDELLSRNGSIKEEIDIWERYFLKHSKTDD